MRTYADFTKTEIKDQIEKLGKPECEIRVISNAEIIEMLVANAKYTVRSVYGKKNPIFGKQNLYLIFNKGPILKEDPELKKYEEDKRTGLKEAKQYKKQVDAQKLENERENENEQTKNQIATLKSNSHIEIQLRNFSLNIDKIYTEIHKKVLKLKDNPRQESYIDELLVLKEKLQEIKYQIIELKTQNLLKKQLLEKIKGYIELCDQATTDIYSVKSNNTEASKEQIDDALAIVTKIEETAQKIISEATEKIERKREKFLEKEEEIKSIKNDRDERRPRINLIISTAKKFIKNSRGRSEGALLNLETAELIANTANTNASGNAETVNTAATAATVSYNAGNLPDLVNHSRNVATAVAATANAVADANVDTINYAIQAALLVANNATAAAAQASAAADIVLDETIKENAAAAAAGAATAAGLVTAAADDADDLDLTTVIDTANDAAGAVIAATNLLPDAIAAVTAAAINRDATAATVAATAATATTTATAATNGSGTAEAAAAAAAAAADAVAAAAAAAANFNTLHKKRTTVIDSIRVSVASALAAANDVAKATHEYNAVIVSAKTAAENANDAFQQASQIIEDAAGFAINNASLYAAYDVRATTALRSNQKVAEPFLKRLNEIIKTAQGNIDIAVGIKGPLLLNKIKIKDLKERKNKLDQIYKNLEEISNETKLVFAPPAPSLTSGGYKKITTKKRNMKNKKMKSRKIKK